MIRKRQSRLGGSGKKLSVYSNISARRRSKKDANSRRKAEYLASLPKNPLMRTAHRLHPGRVMSYWFSREGLMMGLKIWGIAILFGVLAIGAIFAYYRRELDAIRPAELAKRVQTTVTKYYDRNGTLLWEDKGAGDYRLVVPSDDIAKYMKQATIAIEDKDFYKHSGVSFSGIARATYNNFSGGSTQGGSTLTQQLVKQVFFADEAQQRGVAGIPRKLKEAILAVEVERMYNKDQIINLYLNESPYGGRRNGVESASQTYFAKPAKNLTLAESALLASIPQQPGFYDPYNTSGNEALLKRQHLVLKNMAEQGYITKEQAEEAKKVPVLDTIKPETDQYANLKAPHFIQYVRSQLEKELGKATVGKGGLVVKTTLDYRVQERTQTAMKDLFNSYLPASANFDNGAVTIVDNKTGQLLALQGSRDYKYPGYGQDNAAISYIQPGSSIKPFVYAALFEKKPSGQLNYGTGTILRDEPIDQIYGARLENFDHRFNGNLTIRQSLAQSRNIPAVKAMYITGQKETLKTIQKMGDTSYCTDGVDKQVGLAAAIGGCGLKQIEHANTFATLARGGVYKPVATVLEVKNAQNEVIKKWEDKGKKVLDPQIAYMLQSVLSDDNARSPSFGFGASGLNVPGVKTFTKTGTSNLGSQSKDLWMNSVSTKATMSIWVGNHDTRPMSNALSSIVGPTVDSVMGPIHTDVFAKDGSWKAGDWFKQPAGIQNIRGELFPSWYNQKQSQSTSQMVFDKVSRKKATNCTPEGAKVSVGVIKVKDPVTKKDTIIANDGYDASATDNVHKCTDAKPSISNISYASARVTASVAKGTHPLQRVKITVDGKVVSEKGANATGSYSANIKLTPGVHTVNVEATDNAYYTGSTTKTITVPATP